MTSHLRNVWHYILLNLDKKSRLLEAHITQSFLDTALYAQMLQILVSDSAPSGTWVRSESKKRLSCPYNNHSRVSVSDRLKSHLELAIIEVNALNSRQYQTHVRYLTRYWLAR